MSGKGLKPTCSGKGLNPIYHDYLEKVLNLLIRISGKGLNLLFRNIWKRFKLYLS